MLEFESPTLHEMIRDKREQIAQRREADGDDRRRITNIEREIKSEWSHYRLSRRPAQ